MPDKQKTNSLTDPRRKHAVLVSASLVRSQQDRLIADFQVALAEAFSRAELVELILQSLLFDGYPCALEGLITLKKISHENSTREEYTEPYNRENLQIWFKRGEKLCQEIYGGNFSPLLNNVASLSPTLKEWMLYEGYGRVLARPALPIDVREMGIIAILTVKKLPRQLHSHLRGALRVGISRPELEYAVSLCAAYTTEENIQTASEILRKLS